MSIIRDVSVTLDAGEALRRQGMGKMSDRTEVRPQFMALSHELLAAVDHLHLLEPTIAYELHPIAEVRHDLLKLEDDTMLYGPLLPSLLASARELAAAVCTIGPRLEEKVADYFAQSDPLRAMLLDGIGSAAVDVLVEEVCQIIRREAASRGYASSSPLAPGMRGFPMSEQWRLFQLVPAEQIGVRLTSAAMMVPRKSVSMVIGLGPAMPTWTQLEKCDHCSMKDTCRYRVYAGAGH